MVGLQESPVCLVGLLKAILVLWYFGDPATVGLPIGP